jgi:hypothetical protein
MQEKESPKIAHSNRCPRLVSFQKPISSHVPDGKFPDFLVAQKPFNRPNSRSTLIFDHFAAKHLTSSLRCAILSRVCQAPTRLPDSRWVTFQGFSFFSLPHYLFASLRLLSIVT